MLKQLVGGGDDVFDFGTGTRFQQRQGVDEHGLIGDQFGGLLQFRQRGTGFDALLEHGFGVELDGRRQGRQVVVRLIRFPAWMAHVYVLRFNRHVLRICR